MTVTHIAYEAMLFARNVHQLQLRKYTNNPYQDHLAEVAGIVATVLPPDVNPEVPIAVSWLHDSMEDQGVPYELLLSMFGREVADGVRWLSDMEQGNRAERKAAGRTRLAQAPGWVQTVKVADLISNTSSIIKHDPNFAFNTYLPEKRLLLEVLTKADPRLRIVALGQIADGSRAL